MTVIASEQYQFVTGVDTHAAIHSGRAIEITVNGLRRLSPPSYSSRRTLTSLPALVHLAPKTPSPEPATPTTDDENTNDHELRL